MVAQIRAAGGREGHLRSLGALVLYAWSDPVHYNQYNHFVWQAAAFLEGQAAIRYPVFPADGSFGNAYFQDVLPVVATDGVPRGMLPFPPLPAVLLLPFVAAFGLATNDHLLFTVLAALDVALCWWMLGRLEVRAAIRLATTLFFAFGTVFWYSAQLATTWYQAHIAAIALILVACGLAMGADPAAEGDRWFPGSPGTASTATASAGSAGPSPVITNPLTEDDAYWDAGLTARLDRHFKLSLDGYVSTVAAALPASGPALVVGHSMAGMVISALADSGPSQPITLTHLPASRSL